MNFIVNKFQVSIFLVMLLSVTRTIAIAFPLYRIRKFWALFSIVLYSFVLFLEPLVGLIDRIDYQYIYNGNNPNCFQRAAPGLPYYFQYLLEATSILLFSTITFASFLVTVIKLYAVSRITQSPSEVSVVGRQQWALQAAITVAILTAIFLISNLPMVANVVLASITTMHYSFPGPIFSNFYMNYYSWVVSKVVCVVLNASLNPVLYLGRMKGFDKWTRKRGKMLIFSFTKHANTENILTERNSADLKS